MKGRNISLARTAQEALSVPEGDDSIGEHKFIKDKKEKKNRGKSTHPWGSWQRKNDTGTGPFFPIAYSSL
ncbi:hypothetical protein ccbrp13_07460 [Ktedonobacteria bacterium brp13]|nr:hypothetical protein ccbrp13_07460 [Ktedonobacteria bacterium brp13]